MSARNRSGELRIPQLLISIKSKVIIQYSWGSKNMLVLTGIIKRHRKWSIFEYHKDMSIILR